MSDEITLFLHPSAFREIRDLRADLRRWRALAMTALAVCIVIAFALASIILEVKP